MAAEYAIVNKALTQEEEPVEEPVVQPVAEPEQQKDEPASAEEQVG